jgi:hypothetical protein
MVRSCVVCTPHQTKRAWTVANMEEKRNAYWILVWEEKRPPGRSRYKWENYIKNGPYKIECKGVS